MRRKRALRLSFQIVLSLAKVLAALLWLILEKY